MAIYRQTIEGGAVMQAEISSELEHGQGGRVEDSRTDLQKAHEALNEYGAHLDRRHTEGKSDNSLYTALQELQGWQLKRLYAACKTVIAEGKDRYDTQGTKEPHGLMLHSIKGGVNDEWKRRKTLERDNPEQAKAEQEARNEVSERTGKPKKAPRGKPFGQGKDSRRQQEQGQGDGEQESGDGEGEGEGGSEGDGSLPKDEPLENPMDEHIRKIARAEDAKLAKAIDKNFGAVGREIGKIKRDIASGKFGGSGSKTIILRDWDKAIIEIDEVTHESLEKILKAFAAGFKNVFLVGPAGCGKTTLARQAAKALSKILDRDMPFGMVQGSVGVTESAFFGRFLPQGESGAFSYIETDFVNIYENGGVFLGDEMDALDANVFVSLNAPLDNGFMFLPNRIGKTRAVRNDHCYFIGAANTYGHGPNRQYVGRNQLDAASLDRFVGGTFEVTYDRGMEAKLCDDRELLAECWRIRDVVLQFNIRRVWGTRAILAAAKWRSAGLSLKAAIRTAIGDSWSPDDLSKIGYSGAKPQGAM